MPPPPATVSFDRKGVPIYVQPNRTTMVVKLKIDSWWHVHRISNISMVVLLFWPDTTVKYLISLQQDNTLICLTIINLKYFSLHAAYLEMCGVTGLSLLRSKWLKALWVNNQMFPKWYAVSLSCEIKRPSCTSRRHWNNNLQGGQSSVEKTLYLITSLSGLNVCGRMYSLCGEGSPI